MIKNNLRIAWRGLIHNKGFSTLNIVGLALGLACSLLIMLWIQDELNMDKFHRNSSQLYQVYERNYYDGKVDASYHTQGLLAEELKKLVPEIEYASSLEQKAPYPYIFEAGNKIMKLDGSFASADFFKMFSYEILFGNKETALQTPNGIAISKKMASQFFTSPERAIGKSIRFENKEDLVITAVFENPPAASSVQFDFLRNWKDYAKQNAWVGSWGSSSPYTFIQLHKDAKIAKVKERIKDFIHLYTARTENSYTELGLQPYTEKYLYSTFKNGYIDGGRIEYVRLFSLVAAFILLIGCINFMNLATARSARRLKEIGIRKVAGAMRSGLFAQFIAEALLLTFFSIVIAILLTGWLLPAFNDLTGKQLSLPFNQPFFLLSITALFLLTGFLAGGYPAFFLSSLTPGMVLKGTVKFSGRATIFRKGLVIFQFALSILLIVSMIIIFQQVQYTRSKNLGYDRQNLLYIPLEGDLISNYDFFKQEAGKMPGIRGISKMKESPTVIGHHTGDIGWEGKDANLVISFADATVGYDFATTMHLTLKEGRDFSREYATDSTGYLLNETAVAKIGYDNPIGRQISWGNKKGKVIGVLKDFHFNSFHSIIEPLVIRLSESQKWGYILVRIEAGKTRETLSRLTTLCKKLNPGYPFTYQFSDQEYAKLYNNEHVVSKLSGYFAFLAIFISCLGLFGLARFTAQQRTKEIGVRKVLGASVHNIFLLLTTNFLQPVLIAMVVAFPLAWYVMNKWLENYAYKIGISWWIFGLAGILAVGIALLTVGYQTVKAALTNPVNSLRTE